MIRGFGTYVFTKNYSELVLSPIDCQDLILYVNGVTGGGNSGAWSSWLPGLFSYRIIALLREGPRGALAEMTMTKRTLEK